MVTNEITQVVVTVSDSGMNKFNFIKNELQEMGMHIEKVMPKLGVISGSTSNPAVLRSVEGVESVNVDYAHELPKPKSKVQ